MNVTQYFKLALKSLRTSKMRAFLTMLGIIIGVAAVIIIISLGNGLTRMVEQRVEKLGVTQIMVYTWGMGDGTTDNVTPQEIYGLVEANPDVFSGVTPWVSAGTGVRRGDTQLKKTAITGVSEAMYRPETGTTLDGDALGRGRFLQYVDVQQRKNVCVIGAYVEREAFQGDALGRELLVGGVPYTVVGVMAQSQTTMEEGGVDDLVYVPYENAMQLSGSGFVSLYQLTARTRDTVEQARALLRGPDGAEIPRPGRGIQRIYDHHHAGAGAADQRHDGGGHGCAGGHRRHQSAGGGHRHHEHHAGLRHRAHPGDRHPQVSGGQAPGHPVAVHHRGGHHLRRRRPAGHRPGLFSRQRHRLCSRRDSGPEYGRRHHLLCHPHPHGRGRQLRRVRGHRRVVRIFTGQQGGEIESH